VSESGITSRSRIKIKIKTKTKNKSMIMAWLRNGLKAFVLLGFEFCGAVLSGG
jgi:hypothetical protein